MANTLPVRYSPPATDELHPWVYRAIIGLTIWLVLSVWVLFSRGTYEGLTLSVITLFFLILVGIPVLLWLTWRRNTDPKEQHGFVAPFHDWAVVPNLDRRCQRPRSINANPIAHRRRRLRHDDIRPRISVRGSAPRFIVIRPGRSASSAV
jgi:hypothetical protein